MLTYRLPREPSTPRIALWRALKRLGAVQVVDGAVALPADARTREQLGWLAQQVTDSGGQAIVWDVAPASRTEQRQLTERVLAGSAAEYAAIEQAAGGAADLPQPERRRLVAKLRRDLRAVRRRDFFGAPERRAAERAVDLLAETAAEVPA